MRSRFLFKMALVLVVLGILAAGLVPPLLDRPGLDTDALDAARAASLAVETSQNSDAAQSAAAQSVATHPGVQLVKVAILTEGLAPAVAVTVSEDVHTFMDGVPGLKRWFHISATQDSQLGE